MPKLIKKTTKKSPPPPPAKAKKPALPVKKLAPPPAAVSKPRAKKARAQYVPIDPALDYRKLRKYTVPMLENIIKELKPEATLRDLMRHLKKLELQKKDWRAIRGDGTPRKIGRPSKADLEARAKAAKLAKVKPVADPAAVFAKAKAGSLVPPPKPALKAPPSLPAKKPVLKLKKAA